MSDTILESGGGTPFGTAESVTVVGAGLAGSECAWQLAERGIPVTLYEMRPERFTPAHHTADFAELVCSNSLRSDELSNAVGLLKAEMRKMNSLVMRAADHTKVAAGGALAVDRTAFSREITEALEQHPLVTVIRKEVTRIPEGITVIASGPLSSDAITEQITGLCPEFDLHFYDAVAPIVTLESVDMENAYFASRYDKGTADYVNCPMTKEEYTAFVRELVSAEEAEVHGFDDGGVFEGCMPVEVMARRGEDTLRYGPLKPVGLRNPRTGKEDYAVVQLRQDNTDGTLFNMVGFQTHLKWGEQKRVFSMIPALRNADFVRYGVMHRNTYLNSPGQHLSEQPRPSGPVLSAQITAANPLCRTDDRRGGLCGVGCLRHADGHRDGGRDPGTGTGGFPAGDGHRGAQPLCLAGQHRRFSADEHQLRNHQKPGLPGEGKTKQECRDLPAFSRHSGRTDEKGGFPC